MSKNKIRTGSRILALALFLSTVNGLAAADYEKVTEKQLINGDAIKEYRLKNGMKVLLVPRHQAKVLTYQTWFEVGSVGEKLDAKLKKTGLAHLFEHMMFRGSDHFPDGKFDEITARLGGDKQNATTYYYRTNYYESIPSANLAKLMEMEADRMRHLKLTADGFEKEKGAVVGELRRALDQPSRFAWDELMRQMFPQAPYRWTVLGTEGEIKGFTLAEAQYYYNTYYAPNNATLIVIGDTEEKELLPMVVKYYGKMDSQNVPRHVPKPEEPQADERRYEGTHKQATSEILMIGYRSPSVISPDFVPLSLLSTHLSRGMEARLRKLLVDKGIAVSASAGTSNKPDAFEFSVQMVEGHHAEEALAVIDREIANLQRRPISKLELQRALNQELLNLYGDIGDNSELGNWLGEYLMLCGNYMRGFEIIEAYKALTARDLMKAAKNYLKPKSRSIVIIRPEASKGGSASPASIEQPAEQPADKTAEEKEER